MPLYSTNLAPAREANTNHPETGGCREQDVAEPFRQNNIDSQTSSEKARDRERLPGPHYAQLP